jgi:hypothetical protein
MLILLCLILLFNGNLKAQPIDYYKPMALVNPGHFDIKEYSFTIGYDGGIDLNFSYTLPKNIALVAAGNVNVFKYNRKASVDYTIHNNNFSGLAGLGYFKHRQYKFFNIVEMFVGARISSVDNYIRKENSTSESSDDMTKAEYLTIFGQLQTNALKKKYGLFFASRISLNNYQSFEFYRRSKTQISEISGSFNLLSLEPAFGVTIPINNIRTNLQLGVSLPIYSEDAIITETFTASNTTNEFIESYGDFYFFWRLSFTYLKTKWKLR